MGSAGGDRTEALFERLVARFAEDPAVTPPSRGEGGKFGASALKVDGRIFAMVVKDELALKLPRERVEELVASGAGRPFDRGDGRLMKEWVTVDAARAEADVDGLADEAYRFVSG
jgi:hypothetical protein